MQKDNLHTIHTDSDKQINNPRPISNGVKQIFFIATFIFVFGFALFPNFSFAQGIMGSNTANSDGHTAREEAEGKAVWEKLSAKELACKDLSDDNFGTLGEYFMGQMMSTSHE